ncbi:hypothetical protein [Streptomyces justiciae]|uniref:hypothetical protein n=1 Tax=Streptomyces justiciae TaxID=2780140 RepID=UPI00211949B4|nr:hypothetical protein [Streptomyces justiciae]MCW8382674.1 hypothetical protein [Streptomyces justiciae]
MDRIVCLDARYQVDHHPSDLAPVIDLLRELLTLLGDRARHDHEHVALASYLISRADPDRPDLPEAEARLATGELADFYAGIDVQTFPPRVCVGRNRVTGLSYAGGCHRPACRDLEDVDPGWSMTPCPADVPLRAALELCPRSAIVSEGVIAADGPTGGIVADEELMAPDRLELPFGFVSSSTGWLWSDRLDAPVVRARVLRAAAESRL